MKFAKTLVAAAALVFGGQAYAQYAGPLGAEGDLNVSGSNLVLAIWDFDNSQQFILDTGVDFNSIETLADGVVTNVAGDIAGLGANFEWQVFATDDIVGGGIGAPFGDATVENTGARLFTTTDDLAFTASNQELISMTESADNALQGSGIGGWAGRYGQVGTITSDASLTGFGSIDFALLEDIAVSGGFPTVVSVDGTTTTALGSFEFAANGDLIYSAVPLPAAAWLMLSAIAGLAGVARRRA